MSRHRNVRNMRIEDYEDDEYVDYSGKLHFLPVAARKISKVENSQYGSLTVAVTPLIDSLANENTSTVRPVLNSFARLSSQSPASSHMKLAKLAQASKHSLADYAAKSFSNMSLSDLAMKESPLTALPKIPPSDINTKKATEIKWGALSTFSIPYESFAQKPPSKPRHRPTHFSFLISSFEMSAPSNTTSFFKYLTPLDDDAYDFDEPSPDDIVIAARAPQGKHNKPKEHVVKAVQKKAREPLRTTDEIENDLKSIAIKESAKKQGGRLDIKNEYSKRVLVKERLNLVVVGTIYFISGHVDSGKSTLMGHMLVLLGQVNKRTVNKFKKEADTIKKGSFMYAWVLDATDDERARGVTIDVGVTQFSTPNRVYTLLDAPGHRDFIPNMISGCSQADVAILVVDASTGGFETGFIGGQTKEHAQLLYSMGIRDLIVAINKMDLIEWAKDRFEFIEKKLSAFLESIGFENEKIVFCPVSGFTGSNLTTQYSCHWYQGYHLLDVLGMNILTSDRMSVPDRNITAEFILPVQDCFKGGISHSGGGTVSVCGRIESGSIQIGDKILALPISAYGVVKGNALLNVAINVGEDTAQFGVAGDRVTVSLSDLDPIQINLGTVLCDPNVKIRMDKTIKAEISVFDISVPLTIGAPVVLHHLGASHACTLLQLIKTTSTKGVTKANPRVITAHSTAVVVIQLQRNICYQIASKLLGSFLLRRGNESVAAGFFCE